jgi:hypothetical protein
LTHSLCVTSQVSIPYQNNSDNLLALLASYNSYFDELQIPVKGDEFTPKVVYIDTLGLLYPLNIASCVSQVNIFMFLFLPGMFP